MSEEPISQPLRAHCERVLIERSGRSSYRTAGIVFIVLTYIIQSAVLFGSTPFWIGTVIAFIACAAGYFVHHNEKKNEIEAMPDDQLFREYGEHQEFQRRITLFWALGLAVAALAIVGTVLFTPRGNEFLNNFLSAFQAGWNRS